MHYVKSEQDKDTDDYLDNDRKPDGLQQYQRNFQPPYFQHSMSMLNGVGGNYGNIPGNRLKSEVEMKVQGVVGECGVPIPASKPKIWSLADTAACKTPPHLPPNAWNYPLDQMPPDHHMHQAQAQSHQQQMQHQQHHQQHNLQMQDQANHHHNNMLMENGPNIGMNMNMIHPENYGAMCAMSGMMNSFGNDSPYTRYGGLLGHTSHQQIYLNHNSSQSGGSVTPLTPNSACLSTTPTLNQQQQHAIQSNQSMGFPEIQTGRVYFLISYF